MYLGRELKLIVQCLEKIFVHLFLMIMTKFKKQWFDLMPYYVVSFLFGKMNVF